jgi:hypothetical protein
LSAWTAWLLSGSAREASAQLPRLPEFGGRTVSLGQPLRWRWQAGLGAGPYFHGPGTDFMMRAVGGVYHAPLNPIIGLVEFGTEAYVGMRGRKADGGVRALVQVPYISAGVGADYNLLGGRLDMFVTSHTPVRRGGLMTRGSLLRFDWYPLRSHSFTLGFSVPLRDRLAGRNRPIRDYVVVSGDLPAPAPHRAIDPALAAALDSLRVSAEWIRRLVAPFLDQDGRDANVALARTARYVTQLQAHLAVRSVEQEVRSFHAHMEQVFTLASGTPAAGRELSRLCREILLDEILLPYNRMLGRKKRKDTLQSFNVAARGRFGGRAAATGQVPSGRVEHVMFAFQQLTEFLEAVRRRASSEWDDPRLVWLPLQYALLPEDYDEQAELNKLVERATKVDFSDHNRVSYVANLHFHWELLKMIRDTRAYHVLWIHDFPAATSKQTLDWASLVVVDGYLTALADRVEAYDSTGTLPSYFIFLDQHYYEQRNSRMLMRVLEDPLRASGSLPLSEPRDPGRLARALERLRTAVSNSRGLQAEKREYGDDWLRNRIKVHISVTNRPDASFWGGGLVSSVFGYPDDLMRDHRKLAFRDVSEGDPFGGHAILTGMGVGEHYLGPGWDDRSLIVRGPALLDLKRAAHDLLVSQGLTEAEVPPPLRPPPFVAQTLTRIVAQPDAARSDGRAMVLVNGTGYLPKPLNVAKALLYSLMPPGSVITVPDALWNSSFFGGLLVGASLRGAHVLIIAPARANAPSSGFPQMARAHELLTRLLLVRRELGAAITAAGGDLRTGLYALPVDRHGFADRAARWARQIDTTPFLRTLLPFAPALVPQVAAVGDTTRTTDHPASLADSVPPMLHQKVQFLATRESWRAISASAEWPHFMATYLRYREASYIPELESGKAVELADSLVQIAERLLSQVSREPRAASFAMVGSQNQDYRGMFMDGEVVVLLTGPESLVPMVDLVFMVGTVTWIDDQATLDRLLPPVSELMRRIARVTKDGV